MGTFFFNQKQNQAYTMSEIKKIHLNLANLGLKETYDEFLMNLSEYCEGFMEEGEDFYLTDIKAAQHVSDYSLSILEELTQSNLRSKMFAISSVQTQAKTDLLVPFIYVDESEVLEYVKNCAPDLEQYLNIPKTEFGYLVGFAPPSPEATTESFTVKPLPRQAAVSHIKVGTARIVPQNPNGTLAKPITKIMKLSLFVEGYEIPLFRSTGSVHTISVENIPCEGFVSIQDEGVFDIPEYLHATKEIAAKPQTVNSPMTAQERR